MVQKSATYAFGGGLDTNSAALAVKPEALIFGNNYEPLAEGYGRVEGYERFDGQMAPSAASYWSLPFDAGIVAIVAGDTVTGATSGATGVVIAPPYGLTGTWGTDAAGTLVLVNVTGTFLNNEVLNVAAAPHALANGSATQSAAPDEATGTAWLILAQAWYRSRILVVPGSGPVRGVSIHNGSVYAWRDNAGGTACVGFRAIAGGWQQLTASKRIPFTAGLVAGILEGDAVVGATSGATGTVVRVVISSGSFASNNAAGFLHVTGTVGVWGAESIKVGGTNRATITAASDNTWAPGGRYRTISHNFFGSSNRYRLYGASGVDHAFELVSNTMVPAFTGMASDMPTRVFEIAQHLGLTFAGGSVQISALGEPLVYSVILGAGEIGLGTEITDVVQSNESAVAIFGAQKVATLTGRDTSSFTLTTLTQEAGADPDSAQRIAKTVYVDQRGLRSLTAVQDYGNFKTGTLSGQFEGYFKNKRKAGVAIIGSVVSRTKSQYRLFWNDGTGLCVYMGGKDAQAIPFDYGFTPYCFGEGELADGEGIFIGAADGYVYRIDSGTNYDGIAISAACMTPFNHFGSALQEKRFHKVMLELQGAPSSQISILAQFDYGDLDQPIDQGGNFTVRAGGGLLDVATFDDFYLSDPLSGTAECYIDGEGRNASFVFATTAGLTEQRHILQAYTVNYSMRKVKR